MSEKHAWAIGVENAPVYAVLKDSIYIN